MGLTQHSYDLLQPYLTQGCSIMELGNQTIYFGNEYGKPAKPMFERQGYKHTSVDMNGEDRAIVLDLSEPIDPIHFSDPFDVVTDFGTSEHVEKSFYQAWKNKHNWCKIGGYIISENPKTGNWPGHGFNYVTEDFYKELAEKCEYEILALGEHPAMGNSIDGWNVFSVLRKTKEEFITEKQFPDFYDV